MTLKLCPSMLKMTGQKTNSGDKAEPVGGADSRVHSEYLPGLVSIAVVKRLSPSTIHQQAARLRYQSCTRIECSVISQILPCDTVSLMMIGPYRPSSLWNSLCPWYQYVPGVSARKLYQEN